MTAIILEVCLNIIWGLVESKDERGTRQQTRQQTYLHLSTLIYTYLSKHKILVVVTD